MRLLCTLLLSAAVILVLVAAGCTGVQTGTTTGNSSTTTPQAVAPTPAGSGTAGTGCPAGTTSCSDGYCHDTTSDHGACGGCGNVCPTGDICSSSVCVVPATTANPSSTPAGSGTTGTGCPSGTTACSDGHCHDTKTDHDACGGCGNVCPAGDICSSSVCVVPATQGTTTSATTAPTVTAAATTAATTTTTVVTTTQTISVSKLKTIGLITVVTPGDTGGGCSSLLEPYSLTSISPKSGPVSGGTAITITGSGFQNAVMSIYFGSTKVSGFSNSNDGTTIWVTSPKASAAGTVDIRVVGASGILGDANACATSVTSADQFTYTA